MSDEQRQQQPYHHPNQNQQQQQSAEGVASSSSSSTGIEGRLQRLQVTAAPTTNHRRSVLSASPQRPFDMLGRPPADPIPFDRPRFQRGRRDDVLCYNATDDSHTQLRNVLFRDFRDGDSQVQFAYYPTPYKVPIRTIMGHVEICIVLERCKRHKDDDDDDDNDDSSCDDEDDIVFQWTERKVAVKVNSCATMERLKGRHAEDPWKEIASMQLIGTQHENVLGCIEALFDGQNLNVVMPYCDSGDLFQLLQDTQENNRGIADAPPGLSEGQARYWFRQVMKGVQYLHSDCGICHRDLSPENIMIDQRTRGVVIDMGMCLRVPYPAPDTHGTYIDLRSARTQLSAERLEDAATIPLRRCLFKPQGTCGKLPYMSPEIYRNRDPFDGEAADIWTSGTILFCMVTGNRSYQRPHLSDAQFYWMTMGLEQLLRDWHVQLSPEGTHLLQNMLQVDPRLRLTLDEVMTHPWFAIPDEQPTIPMADPDGGMMFDVEDD